MPTANLAKQAAIDAVEPQTFATESDRARLSEIAVKAFLALSKAWRCLTPRPPPFSAFRQARSTA